MTLGERLQQIRLSAGMTQEEFGQKLDTSRQTVSKWELDISIPEIEKIVKISQLFSVTTDSILVEGISTFLNASDRFVCGVYKFNNLEVVETEKCSFVYYSNEDKTVFGVKVYIGTIQNKTLQVIVERNEIDQKTYYAYLCDETPIFNNEQLKNNLGEKYDSEIKNGLYMSEKFYVRKDDKQNNTVDKVGIKNCLTEWRMINTFTFSKNSFFISMCTGVTEYVVSIQTNDDNIYCNISYNISTEVGLLSGAQYFRIRNYKDNSEPFCSFHTDLGYKLKKQVLPLNECVSGKCVQTSKGLFFGVKRYNDNEIVLYGCGDDEYHYHRNTEAIERFTTIF